MVECVICGRGYDSESNFCMYHQTAHRNLKEAFDGWKHGLDIDWDEYLNRLLDLDGLGIWVRDVIVHLRSGSDS